MITLKPRTKRGRQIVKEFGDQWMLRKEEDSLPSGAGPWLYVLPESVIGRHPCIAIVSARWVHATDDDHFEVIR